MVPDSVQVTICKARFLHQSRMWLRETHRGQADGTSSLEQVPHFGRLVVPGLNIGHHSEEAPDRKEHPLPGGPRAEYPLQLRLRLLELRLNRPSPGNVHVRQGRQAPEGTGEGASTMNYTDI